MDIPMRARKELTRRERYALLKSQERSGYLFDQAERGIQSKRPRVLNDMPKTLALDPFQHHHVGPVVASHFAGDRPDDVGMRRHAREQSRIGPGRPRVWRPYHNANVPVVRMLAAKEGYFSSGIDTLNKSASRALFHAVSVAESPPGCARVDGQVDP